MSALFAYRNLFDAWPFNIDGGPGTSNVALSGYPLTNLKKRQLSSVARITNNDIISGNPLWIPFAPLSAVQANVVVVIGDIPNGMGVEGTLDSGSIVAFSTDYSGIGLPSISFFIIPPSYGDLVRVTLEYGIINPPAYAQIARVFVANALVLPEGIDSNWQLGVDDPGTLDVSAGRQWYESPLPRTRRLSMNVSAIPTLLAFGFAEGATTASEVPSFQDMQMVAGATGEVFVIPRSSNGLWIRRAAVYGHFERPPVLRHRAGPNFETDLVVIEER